jgi:2-polyprenyl-3-methyl-5-hydroxy-6-metoxy-1,4-benzoquinol methylase
MSSFDLAKDARRGEPRYVLSNARVFVSPTGFHFIDYQDPTESISPEIDRSQLGASDIAYIERMLQSNNARFSHQVSEVLKLGDIRGKTALDIGCGGGLFLSKLRDAGAKVMGIELSDSRAHYAQDHMKLQIEKRTIESAYWASKKDHFDIVTLWDVIEHVNRPGLTLESAARVLKPGGHILIDTPCRDAFYHRFGAFTYRLTGGIFPTFLNAMYSAHLFGHKQIFATWELRKALEDCNLEVLKIEKFHELSFPHDFYLKKIFKSDLIVKLIAPSVNIALMLFPIRNKMIVVARKKL